MEVFMKKSKKIIFLVLSIIAFALLCGMNKSEAATVLWPIGGDNAADTYIEYGYGPRTYKSQDYIARKSRRFCPPGEMRPISAEASEG